MRKEAPYIIEVGLGALLVGLVAWGYHGKSALLETTSLKTYDLFSKFRKPASKNDAIHIIEIDEESVANLGRWPWPRSLVAQLVDEVVAGGAKVIGLNIFYTEPDQNQGMEELTRLYESFSSILEARQTEFKRKRVRTDDLDEFLTQLGDAKDNLNGDAILAGSIEEAGRVVLPMYFQPGDALGNNLEPLPSFFERERLALPTDDKNFPLVPSGVGAILPMGSFGSVSLAVGHSNLWPDRDGTVRRMASVMRYGESYYPSFAWQLVRTHLQLEQTGFAWEAENGFRLGRARIPLDEEARTFLEFAGPAGTFERSSAIQVLSGGIPENTLNGKIALIGVTAPGLEPHFVVPTGETFTGLEIWATHIANILNQTFLVRPRWATKAEWGFLLLAALVVIGVLPLMRARFSVPITALVFFGILGGTWFLFVKKGIWVSPAYASVLLVTAFAVLVGKRLILTEKRKEWVEAEGVETNKMLGLSFQGQGMLDLAFEKFRRCPIDDSMKELLYNLGLDMERKRQFTKAAAVYEHIATVDAKYKDISEKIELLKKAGEGAVFGGLGKKGSDATVVVEGLGQNTTLGRYEVMKELGRGAMGIVYLGRDPKINRQVAIKTLRFEDNTDEEQTKSIKERFFREAESAGNLTHPNIIRIFDAGEDQEVAYIAMELLEGEDLKRFCDKAHLMPIPKVLDLVAHVADGLDYAHRQGVVHRDIKPGNIMLLKDETLRITDFGIARIQASSKTATGAVLGTPAYMSPEQVNGKKVDGRADIFSLGVTLFELLTGEKPFAGDSIAALLYRIANVDHPDPREFRKDLPVSIMPIINKALAKDPENRYQTAGQMAADLRECMKNLSSGSASSKSHEAPLVQQTPKQSAVETATRVEAELKQALNDGKPKVEESTLQDTMSERTKNPLESEKTVAQDKKAAPPPNAVERTVTWEQGQPSTDIPVLPSIEGGFQPPHAAPNSSSDDKPKLGSSGS